MNILPPAFIEKSCPPDEVMLEAALGETYEFFRQLVDLTRPLHQEWKFYSPKYGWTFKVFQKKKVLFYLVPNKAVFTFGMALREAEKESLLAAGISQRITGALKDSEKVMEGYPLRFVVDSTEALEDIRQVIGVLDGLRKLGFEQHIKRHFS